MKNFILISILFLAAACSRRSLQIAKDNFKESSESVVLKHEEKKNIETEKRTTETEIDTAIYIPGFNADYVYTYTNPDDYFSGLGSDTLSFFDTGNEKISITVDRDKKQIKTSVKKPPALLPVKAKKKETFEATKQTESKAQNDSTGQKVTKQNSTAKQVKTTSYWGWLWLLIPVLLVGAYFSIKKFKPLWLEAALKLIS